MKHLQRHWAGLALIVIDAAFFTLTNPAQVSAWVLIVALVLMAISVYLLFRGVVRFGQHFGVPAGAVERPTRYLTGIVVIVLALNSIGELTLRDVAVLIPLAVLLYVYMTYARSRDVKD